MILVKTISSLAEEISKNIDSSIFSDFVKTSNIHNDNYGIIESEKETASLIGITTDYATRYFSNGDFDSAFKFALRGFKNFSNNFSDEGKDKLNNLLQSYRKQIEVKYIKGFLRLCIFDSYYRNSEFFDCEKSFEIVEKCKIEEMKILFERSFAFFQNENKIEKYGVEVSNDELYIRIAGDLDYITNDTLWDMKCSKNAPSKSDKIQLCLYYLAYKNSFPKDSKKIKKLGIYNPRRNEIYLINVDSIDFEVIKNTIHLAYPEIDEDEKALKYMINKFGKKAKGE